MCIFDDIAKETGICQEKRYAKELLTFRAGGVLNHVVAPKNISEFRRVIEAYEKLKSLKRALSKLLDPFDGEMTQRQIVIHAKTFLKRDEDEAAKALKKGMEPCPVNGNVSNPLFSVLQDKTTSINARITDGRLCVCLEDRGTFIYSSEENLGEEYSLLKDVSLDASIAYLNQAAKATFARRMGLDSVSYGSLFLVKNGFRIYPIGEENNDFWGIDRRKQQGYNRYLGSREVLGRIRIESDDDSMFRA